MEKLDEKLLAFSNRYGYSFGINNNYSAILRAVARHK